METSAFNAEAPTEPAGETVGCRRQLGGIVKQIHRQPQKLVATVSRREGVYNRTGDLSVICFGEEEQRNECEAIKNRRKRYVACDDVAGVAESDKASLVACNNLYVPFASQKMD